jgi:hypothetical protein
MACSAAAGPGRRLIFVGAARPGPLVAIVARVGVECRRLGTAQSTRERIKAGAAPPCSSDIHPFGFSMGLGSGCQ